MKNTRSMKRLRAAVIFVFCVAVIQAGCIVAFTHKGEALIYPLVRRVFAEKINIENNSYVEYYNIREHVGNSEIFIVGGDGRVGQTYGVLSDFLKYIKQNVNVNIIALEIGHAETAIINDCIYSQDDIQFSEKIRELEGLDGMSLEFVSFVESLYKINCIMSPDRKVTVAGIGLDSTASAICDVLDEMLKPLYSELKGNYKAYIKTDKIDVFVDYFYENAAEKADVFGDSYQIIKDICDEYDTLRKLGKNTDEKLFQALNQVVRQNEGKNVFAVVLPERLVFGAAFRTLAADVLSKSHNVLMTDIRYHACTYMENGEKLEKSELVFPMFVKEFRAYLIRKESAETVTGYYKKVTKSPEAVNEYDFPFSIVISNGTEITPYSSEDSVEDSETSAE